MRALALVALLMLTGPAFAEERTGKSDSAGQSAQGDGPSAHDRDGNGIEDALDPNSPHYNPNTTPDVDYTGWCCRYPDDPNTPEEDPTYW